MKKQRRIFIAERTPARMKEGTIYVIPVQDSRHILHTEISKGLKVKLVSDEDFIFPEGYGMEITGYGSYDGRFTNEVYLENEGTNSKRFSEFLEDLSRENNAFVLIK
ncbi:MAG: hypothetical protein AABX28_03685 [Nanoarchaeota archaeon]